MRRSALLLAIALASLSVAKSAAAQCSDYTVVEYQVTDWWDGTQTVQILSITDYTVCDVSGTAPPPDSGGTGPMVTLSANVAWVDTTDPNNPVVAVDVSTYAPYDPVSYVVFEVNGSTVDYDNYAGDGRYQFDFGAIGNYGQGNTPFDGKVCTQSGVCSTGGATINRFVPSPNTADATINASWQEEDPEGPVTRFASYGHDLRQMYTTTTFTCSELGQNSHYEIDDSLVTISGNDPMPMWSSYVQTRGTINNATYNVATDSASPIACTFPTECSSKVGSSSGTFGYMPVVDEYLSSFVIDGQSAIMSSNSLEVTFQ